MSLITDSIQAASAAALVVLTWRTLVVLRDYARDTKTLAMVSQEQIEGAVRPVISIYEGHVDSGSTVMFKNVGAGLARNLKWTQYHGVGKTAPGAQPILEVGGPPLYGGMTHDVLFSEMFEPVPTYTVEYESVLGQKYMSIAEWPSNDNMYLPPTLRIEKRD